MILNRCEDVITPNEWWYEAFPIVPYEKAPPGEKEMLTLIGYDISDPKRLARVARIC